MTGLEELRAVALWLDSPETARKLKKEKISVNLSFTLDPSKDDSLCETHFLGTTSGAVLTTCSAIASQMEKQIGEHRQDYFSKVLDFLGIYVEDDEEEQETEE